jgi:perosamine synthetase
METIDAALRERQALARMYNEALAPLADALVLPTVRPGTHHVYWMYTVYLRKGGESERNAVMRALDQQGIETRPVFYPMHVLPPYLEDKAYPVADEWAQRGINLPTHQFLRPDDIGQIAAALRSALGR